MIKMIKHRNVTINIFTRSSKKNSFNRKFFQLEDFFFKKKTLKNNRKSNKKTLKKYIKTLPNIYGNR